MKVEDLKIGNYVNEYEEVYSISKDGTVEVFSEGSIPGTSSYFKNKTISDINPILLTEEWILKLGFDKVDISYWFKQICITSHNGRFIYDASNRFVIIEYVHELQNLISLLTKNK